MVDVPVRDMVFVAVAVPAEAPSTNSLNAPEDWSRVKTTWCQAPLL